MTVIVKMTGQNRHALVNEAVARGHIIHALTIEDNEWRLEMSLRTFHYLRKRRRRYGCRIRIQEKRMPLRDSIRSMEVPVSLLTAALILFLLSNMIWFVEIEGVSREKQFIIEEELQDNGYYEGAVALQKDRFRELEYKILNNHPDLIWVTIARKGTILHVQASEREKPAKEEERSSSDLVASEDGTIVRMVIRRGKPLVEANQSVEKGEVLVSGRLDEDTYVKATGEVWAETWYTVEWTGREEALGLAGKEKGDVKHYLALGSWKIPVWGFFTEEEGEWEEKKVTLTLFGKKTPFSYRKRTYQPLEEDNPRREEEALERGERHLLSRLTQGARIREEKVLHQYRDSGKVKLILLYQVHENIAETKYINQGD